MADNTNLNPGTGGDLVRAKDRSGIKTQIVGIDIDPGGGAEKLIGEANPIPSRQVESGTTVFLTTTPLGIGASVDTGWIDTSKLGAGFTILVKADKDGTIYHDHSPTGSGETNVATTDCTTPYVANEAHAEGHTAYARYSRFRFVNTSGQAQSSFFFTVLQRHTVHWSTVRVSGVADTNVLSVPTDPFGVIADAAGTAGSFSAKLRYLCETGIAGKSSLPAGTNNIGDVDVLTVPADPFGANADAIVAAGAVGTMQAKLRRITQGLEDLKTLLVLAAGSAIIGKVGIDQTTPGTTNFVAANVTQLNGTARLAGNGVTGAGSPRVTIASDNTPFAIKTDQTTHGTTDLVAADITKINGVALLAGAGNTGTGSPRVTIASDQAILPVKEQAVTTGGCDSYVAIATAAVLATNIKASAGQIYGWAITNTTAAPLFVRLYDLATSPVGTDTPDIRLMIPANGGNNISLPQGHACAAGIGIRATGAVADNDATALTANSLLINVFYK